MRHLFLTSSFILAFAASPVAVAGGNGFETSIVSPAQTLVKVEVMLSEDLAYRATNLPKSIRDRRSSRLNDAFGNNGYYGERDLDRMAERLQKKVVAQLTKRGVGVSDTAPTVLRVTLTDAKPNRPTLGQLSKDISLSYRSFGIGGADIDAQLVQSGEVLGDMSYTFYENDIRDAQFGGTWSDAYRAIDRFARNAAKTLEVKS